MAKSNFKSEQEFENAMKDFMSHLKDPFIPKMNKAKREFFLAAADCHVNENVPEEKSMECEQRAFQKVQAFEGKIGNVVNSAMGNLMRCIGDKCKRTKDGKVENPTCFGPCYEEATKLMKEGVKSILE